MATKKCTKCKQDKPATLEFFFKNTGKQPLSWHCKACVLEVKRIQRIARKERSRQED